MATTIPDIIGTKVYQGKIYAMVGPEGNWFEAEVGNNRQLKIIKQASDNIQTALNGGITVPPPPPAQAVTPSAPQQAKQARNRTKKQAAGVAPSAPSAPPAVKTIKLPKTKKVKNHLFDPDYPDQKPEFKTFAQRVAQKEGLGIAGSIKDSISERARYRIDKLKNAFRIENIAASMFGPLGGVLAGKLFRVGSNRIQRVAGISPYNRINVGSGGGSGSSFPSVKGGIGGGIAGSLMSGGGEDSALQRIATNTDTMVAILTKQDRASRSLKATKFGKKPLGGFFPTTNTFGKKGASDASGGEGVGLGTSILGGFGGAIAGLLSGRILISAFKALFKAGGKFLGPIGLVVNLVWAAWEGIQKFMETDDWKSGLAKFLATFLTFGLFSDKLEQPIKDIIDSVCDLANNVVKNILQKWEKAKLSGQHLLEDVGDAFKDCYLFAINTFRGIVSFVYKALDAITPDWMQKSFGWNLKDKAKAVDESIRQSQILRQNEKDAKNTRQEQENTDLANKQAGDPVKSVGQQLEESLGRIGTAMGGKDTPVGTKEPGNPLQSVKPGPRRTTTNPFQNGIPTGTSNGNATTLGGGAGNDRLGADGGMSSPGDIGGGGGPSLKKEPRGIRNNNPLNLSYLPNQPGVQGSDGRFGIYGSMEDGVAAAHRQLLIYQSRGNNTVAGMVGKWAPPNENNTNAYIRSVASALGVDPFQPIDVRNKDIAVKMINEMARIENGKRISMADISAGVDKSLEYAQKGGNYIPTIKSGGMQTMPSPGAAAGPALAVGGSSGGFGGSAPVIINAPQTTQVSQSGGGGSGGSVGSPRPTDSTYLRTINGIWDSL